ncbi:response regulator [Balneolales bacterium ANBcel1]|nr:response regulator [Balneolales bacterium ANBcel1]
MNLIAYSYSTGNGVQPAKRKQRESEHHPLARKIKALHIEDDDEIRFLVKAFLKNLVDVDPAADGDEAITNSTNNKYDLIITDINLGAGIDGIEAAREIRNIGYYRNVPIIAATANGTSEVRNQCLEAGMDAFLLKPFMKRDLINTVEQVMENRMS